MQFTDLNIISFLIFILILWSISFFAYKSYSKQSTFNKTFKLLSSKSNFYIKYIFLLFSLLIILMWIFGIKYWEIQNNLTANWIDVMFVLDVSKSMNVADISDLTHYYSRLDIAKKSISDFVINHKQDRFWLVIFAWDAISTIPLTTDHDLFLTMLSWVDYRNLTVQWSDFNKALNLAVDRFTFSDDRSKALIFISDWWDLDDKINKNLLKQISKNIKGISYFVVWVWTKSWWKIIKNRDHFWRIFYQKYKWEYVISKLNTWNLKDIANSVSWDYFNIKDATDLENINSKLNKLEKKAIKTWPNWELADFWRKLAIFSLALFIIFLFLYIRPNSIKKW